MSKAPILYLASGSPRRQELLGEHGITFKLIQHNCDEESVNPKNFSSAESYVRYLAQQKASSTDINNDWVLSADTIVVHENTILPKPKNLEEAELFLTRLSASTHKVLTAYCLFHRKNKQMISRVNRSSVTFNDISHEDIQQYVHDKKPLDKAGGYGIQELPDHFVKRYTGSIYTIIGLPIYSVLKSLKSL